MGEEWDLQLTGFSQWDGGVVVPMCWKLACCLARDAEAGGGGVQVLSQIGGHRECGALLVGWSLPSWSSLSSYSLCLRVPLSLWGFVSRVGLIAYSAKSMGLA